MPLYKPTHEWRTHHFCIFTCRSGNEELSFVMLGLLKGNWGHLTTIEVPLFSRLPRVKRLTVGMKDLKRRFRDGNE